MTTHGGVLSDLKPRFCARKISLKAGSLVFIFFLLLSNVQFSRSKAPVIESHLRDIWGRYYRYY